MNLTLTERRTVVRTLPRAVAAGLAERFGHAVEVVPTFDRRRYKLTARGYVGWVRLGEVTVTFRPKRPWAEVQALFRANPGSHAGGGSFINPRHDCRGSPSTPGSHAGGDDGTTPGMTAGVRPDGLLDLLARRLAALMLARADAGLVRGYVERDFTDTHLRGRIDLPKQLRRPFPSPALFDQTADEWTPDVPWNRIPKAVAVRLLAEPELSVEGREVLERAVAAFGEVSDTLVSVSERAAMTWDARTEPYRELLDWCDLIGSENVLVSLERAFEGYTTRAFVEALGDAVRVQGWVTLSESDRGTDSRRESATLQLTPDLTVYHHSAPVSVWDAKWKRPDPAAADVHQALAYAAVLGVPRCGLVYPGRRWKCETLRAASGVTLHLLRLPLTDDPARWQQVLRRLRRLA